MFAISVRVSPCRARVFVLSSPGVTFTLSGVAAPHEARGCRHDRDPEPAEHARHLALARVDAEPRLADPAQPGDGGELAHVLHPQHELARRRLLVRGDEALVAEDPRDLDAHPR